MGRLIFIKSALSINMGSKICLTFIKRADFIKVSATDFCNMLQKILSKLA